MKRILIILLASLFVTVGKAEISVSDILPSDRNHWTATVSYDVTIPGKWNDEVSMFKFGGGVSLGADYTLLLKNQFLFEPGLRLYYNTFRYDNIFIMGDDSHESMTLAPPVRKTGMRIPLLVGYKLDIYDNGSLYLSTGPELSYGFSARTKVNKDYADIFEENLYERMMRRYDVAWDIRGSIIMNRFRVDVTGAFGLLDVIKTNIRMHEFRASIGLGYIF